MQETNLTRILRVEYQRGKKALQKALGLYRVSLECSADNWSADTCEQKRTGGTIPKVHTRLGIVHNPKTRKGETSKCIRGWVEYS